MTALIYSLYVTWCFFQRHRADGSIGTVKMLAYAPCTWEHRHLTLKCIFRAPINYIR